MSKAEVKMFLNGEEISKTVSEQKPKTKLAICGFAPSWSKTPWKDPDMEVWIINGLYTFFDQVPESHFEALFDMHREQEIIRQDDCGHVKRLKELAAKGVKIYSCEPLQEIPESIVYPLDDIEKMIGRSYWTNTISYLGAYAGYLKKTGQWPELEEVHIYGVDMAQDGEYAHQRPSCEMIAGWLMGLGLKVVIPQESDLLRSVYKYGYDNCPLETKIFRDKIDDHKKQIAAFKQKRTECINWRNGEIQKIESHFNSQINQLDAMINQLTGAMDMSEYYSRLIFSKNNAVPFNPTLTEAQKIKTTLEDGG